MTVRLAFTAGSRFDPPDLRGLAEATGSLLTEGTKRRTSRQIAEEAASIGGAIGAQHSPDALMIAASSLSEHAGELLDLVADVARNASFPAEEVTLYKQTANSVCSSSNRKRSTWLRKSSRKPFSEPIPTDTRIPRRRPSRSWRSPRWPSFVTPTWFRTTRC